MSGLNIKLTDLQISDFHAPECCFLWWHTEKTFSFWGRCPQTPTRGFAPGPHWGLLRPPDPRIIFLLFHFSPFPCLRNEPMCEPVKTAWNLPRFCAWACPLHTVLTSCQCYQTMQYHISFQCRWHSSSDSIAPMYFPTIPKPGASTSTKSRRSVVWFSLAPWGFFPGQVVPVIYKLALQWLPWGFFQVESCQWLTCWHSSGYPARRLVL